MSFLSKHFSLNKIASSPLNKHHAYKPGWERIEDPNKNETEKVVPDSIVTSKATTDLSSKNSKQKQKFRATATSQEINKPNNVSRIELKSRKQNKNRRRSVEKFKAVQNGKLLKSKTVNGKNVRATEKNISNKVQDRKAKRLLNKKFR